MTEKGLLSSSYKYNIASSFLDEAFSLLNKEFVGENDCSSIDSEQNESEHHLSPATCSPLPTSINIVEHNIDHMVLDKLTEKVEETSNLRVGNIFADETIGGNQPIIPIISRNTQYVNIQHSTAIAPGPNFRIVDLIDQMIENQQERVTETCIFRNRNVGLNDINTILGNRPDLVPTNKILSINKAHMETCNLENWNVFEDEADRDIDTWDRPVVPTMSKIPYQYHML
mmetsp:Transcript_9315/g.13922  ORF Transcript_9315/g.13922 Transcript_9315/m.13922 type:complete len:228 (-) Transcript_9315:519-1202(-)